MAANKFTYEISQSITGSTIKPQDTVEFSFQTMTNNNRTKYYSNQTVNFYYSASAGWVQLPNSDSLILPKKFVLGTAYSKKSFVFAAPQETPAIKAVISGSVGKEEGTGTDTSNDVMTEVKIDYDDFKFNLESPKVELTEDGLLVYTSPSRYVRANASGLDILGGDINVDKVTANELEIYGNVSVFGDLQATSIPADETGVDTEITNVSTSIDSGGSNKYARADHIHDLPFSILDDVAQEGYFTQISSSKISGSGMHIKGSAFISGTLEVIDLITRTITASTAEFTGSNIFGDSASEDIHYFTGSIEASGAYHNLFGTNVTMSAANYVKLQDVVYVTGSKVGIGTTTPNKILDISGSTKVFGEMDTHLFVSGSGSANIILRASASDAYETYGMSSTGNKFKINRLNNVGTSTTSTPFTIDNDRVGIGITSPLKPLDVQGNVNIRGTLFTDVVDGYQHGGKVQFNSGDLTIQSNTDDPIIFNTNGANTRMYISGSGNVGIGTTSPTGSLQIDSSTAFSLTSATGDTLFLTDNTVSSTLGAVGASIGFGGPYRTIRQAAITALRTGGDHDHIGLAFYTSPGGDTNETIVQQMVIDHDGNVGIGNTTPSKELTVSGSISASGNLYLETANDPAGTGYAYFHSTDNFISANASDFTIRSSDDNVDVGLHSDKSISISADRVGNGTGQIVFTTNTLDEKMRIANDGKVGIGTNSPGNLLHLYESGSNDYQLKIYQTGSDSNPGKGSAGIYFSGNNDYGQEGYIRINDAGFEFGTTDNEDIIFYPGNNEVLRLGDDSSAPADVWFHGQSSPTLFVSESGKIGIGTKTPSMSLHIEGGTTGLPDTSGIVTTGITHIGNEGGVTFGRDSSSPYNPWIQAQVLTNGAVVRDLLLQPSQGNVGIGNTSPPKLLTVQGDISASGDLYLSDTDGTPTMHFDTSVPEIKSAGATLKINNTNGVDTSFDNGTLYVDASGNSVSIGAGTAPPEKLTVEGNISASGNLTIGSVDKMTDGTPNIVVGGTSPRIYLEDTDEGLTDNGRHYRLQNAGGTFSISEGGRSSTSTTGTSQLFTILEGGNVGIGTDNPGHTLEVKGTESTLARFYDAGNGSLGQIEIGTMDIHVDNNTMKFRQGDDSVVMELQNDGNVGIGTTNPAYTLDVWGNAAIKQSVGTSSFASGFAGYGWRISNTGDAGATGSEGWGMTIDNLTVRGQMKVYELLIQQLRATNGSVWISSTGKVDTVEETSAATFSIQFDTGSNTYGHGFREGDLIRAQKFQGAGSEDVVIRSDLIVTSVGNSGSLTAVTSSTGNTPPSGGFDYVRIGNTTSASRQGAVYLTSDDDEAPYIDIIDGVASHSDFNASNNVKARIGKLDGISDTHYGDLGATPNNYGLYSDNVYLKGGIRASFGEIGGFGIGATVLSSSDNSFILSSSNMSMKLGASADAMTFTSNAGIFMSGSGDFRVGHPTDSNIGQLKFAAGKGLEVTASYINLVGDGVNIDTSNFELNSDGLDISSTHNSMSLGEGKIILSGSNVPVIKIDGGEISASNFFVSSTGEMTASAGLIGGWVISSDRLTGGNVFLDADTNNGIIAAGASSLTSGTGFYTDGNANFRVGNNSDCELKFLNSGGGKLFITSSNVDISGSDVNILTPNFFFGSATSHISGSSTGLIMSSSEFSLDTTDLKIDSANKRIDLGEIRLDSATNNEPYISLNNKIRLDVDNNDTKIYTVNKGSFTTTAAGFYLADENGTIKVNIGDNTSALKFNSGDSSFQITSSNVNLSGSDINIITENLTASGSNVEILTPSFMFGDKGTSYISSSGNQLRISASSFDLRNGNITASNARIDGIMSSSEGNIGGWTIGTDKLSTTGFQLSSSGYIISSSNFQVDTIGNITASGIISSSEGNIGGWTIGTTSFNKNLIELNATSQSLIVKDDLDNEKIKVGSGSLSSVDGAASNILLNNGFELDSGGATSLTNWDLTHNGSGKELWNSGSIVIAVSASAASASEGSNFLEIFVSAQQGGDAGTTGGGANPP